MNHLLWAKNLSMSSLSVCSSQLYESVVNALSSSSSREWFSAESNELLLNKLELSSGDFDRNDIRSKPQLSNVESIIPSTSILGACGWFWAVADDDGCDPLLLCWLLRFGGNGGGLLNLKYGKLGIKWIAMEQGQRASRTTRSSYLCGSGGFGGGLESRSILSVLCDVRMHFVWELSKISRSRGVNGMSGNDVRWFAISTTGRSSVLPLLLLAFDAVCCLSRSQIFSFAICTKF